MSSHFRLLKRFCSPARARKVAQSKVNLFGRARREHCPNPVGVEYASGRLLRRLVGYVPWNYGRVRFSIDGLVRIDYLPLWAAYGLGLERLHDLLVTPERGKGKGA